jgi:hypothetical protein
VHEPLGWWDPLGLSGCKPTRFHKRTSEKLAELRDAFERAGGAKEKFLKGLAAQKDAVKLYGSEAVERMSAGQVPTGKVVHHKKPLFRGGTNRNSNLLLMDASEHTANNRKLHWYEPGNNPYGLD